MSDNYVGHQLKVKKSRIKGQFQIEESNKIQKEVALEDKDKDIETMRKMEYQERIFRDSAQGEAKGIDQMEELGNTESGGMWTGHISVEAYCRHLEFILSSDEEPEPKEVLYGMRLAILIMTLVNLV